MQKAFGNLQDTSGNAIGSATLSVYDAGTSNLSSIYSDNGITPVINPFTTEADSEWSFYAADGDYDLSFVKAGYTTQTFEDLQLLDRASVISALQGVTGFDFIQSATPSASAADEWWLDTDDGTVYKSSAAGSGSWVYQYRNPIYASNGDLNIDDGSFFVKASSNYSAMGNLLTASLTGEVTYDTKLRVGNESIIDTQLSTVQIGGRTGVIGDEVGLLEFFNMRDSTIIAKISGYRETDIDDGGLYLATANGGVLTNAVTIDHNQNIGVGVDTFGTSAAKSLGIGIGTEPGSSIAGQIEIYAKDSSDGSANATLGLRTEQAVEAIGTFTPSHKLKLWINAVEYSIQLDAV